MQQKVREHSYTKKTDKTKKTEHTKNFLVVYGTTLENLKKQKNEKIETRTKKNRS